MLNNFLTDFLKTSFVMVAVQIRYPGNRHKCFYYFGQDKMISKNCSLLNMILYFLTYTVALHYKNVANKMFLVPRHVEATIYPSTVLQIINHLYY